MTIKIKINGESATAQKVKSELELMIGDGLTDGLTRSVLDALTDEVQNSTSTDPQS